MTGGETIHGHGRHRPGTGSWIPQPDPGPHHAHTKALVAPPGAGRPVPANRVVQPGRAGRPEPGQPPDAVVTTVPITGLRSFDLGTVPASVTPPRSWRAAAWFAVCASAGVLAALAIAATAFVGRPSQWSTIDALPGLPRATDPITTLPADAAATAFTRSRRTMQAPSGSPDRARSDPTAPAAPAPPQDPSTTLTGSSGPVPASETTTTTVVEPTRSTITPLVMKAPVNADQIGDRTEQYYATVVDDPGAACAMTSGPMQDAGPDGIKQRYKDVTGVQVERITIDPGTARTTNVVRLHHRDGSVTTQSRVLTFSAGDDPKITDETVG